METKKTLRSGGSAPRFFIVAGEASGDIHAARLMKALKEREPLCQFFGVGGAEMAKEGLQSLAPLEIMNVVGVWEVARRYGRLRDILRVCSELLKAERFDAFIPVDYPGFNMRLAETARKCGAPVLWYIAPQLWAWGEHRAKRLRALVDALFVILPFEEDFFSQRGIFARYVGHPTLELIPRECMPLSERERTIALFPGSREQEIIRNLPIMLRSLELLCARRAEAREYAPHIARANAVPEKLYDALLRRLCNASQWKRSGRFTANDSPPWMWESGATELLRSARAAMVKIGTSTLEAALVATPHLAMYRASPLTHQWAKRVVHLPQIALPNILFSHWKAEDSLTREFIQSQATPENLALEMERLLFDEEYATTMHARGARLRNLLEASAPQGETASRNAARGIWERLR
jgi:lipid-A-disaccharide synthase